VYLAFLLILLVSENIGRDGDGRKISQIEVTENNLCY
jgi:hypothetical protein